MKVCLVCGRLFEIGGWQCPGCGKSPEQRYGYLAFAPDLAEANDNFSAGYFASLAQLESGNFWFESRNRLLVWALRRYFSGARNFLEIGCGTGFVLSGIRQEFPGLVLSGSEIFSEGLAYARQRLPGVMLFQMDARCIPFEGEFDVIGAFDMLEHIEEDEVVLLQMFRATRPGGGIMLTVPQHRFLWSVADKYSFHKRRYTRKELVEKVEQAGFRVIRITSFVSFLLPLMVLSRMKQRKSQDDYDPLAELRISGLSNALLKKILGLELVLIERGFSFLAGGSLLMVASRPWS